MSLIGTLPQSDSLYPVNALWSLEKTKEWLDRTNQDGQDAHTFFGILESMKHHAEFRPGYASNEPEPMVVGGTLEYREPVWKLIHETAARHAPQPFLTEQQCAEWLQDLLHLAGKHFFLKEALTGFKKKLSERGIGVIVDNSGPPAALWIHIDPDASGKTAKVLLDQIVAELIVKLTAHAEQVK